MREMEEWRSPLIYKGKYVPYLSALGQRIVCEMETQFGFLLIVDASRIEKKSVEFFSTNKYLRSSTLDFYYIPADLSGAEWYSTSFYWWRPDLPKSIADGTFTPIDPVPEYRILDDTTFAFRVAGQRQMSWSWWPFGIRRYANGWYAIAFHENPPQRHLALPPEFEARNTGFGMRRHIKIRRLGAPPPMPNDIAAAQLEDRADP